MSYREERGYFSHRPLHHHRVTDFGLAVRTIAAEAAENNCDTIFISSEEFINSLWDSSVTEKLISALNAYFGSENVRLLMFVRNHVGFVESTYAQFLRAGMFRVNAKEFFDSNRTGILGFLNWFRDVNGFNFYSFSDIFEIFRKAAPDNPFEVYSIERDDLDGRDIIDFLAERLGLPSPTTYGPRNERFSDKALLMLRYAMDWHGVEIGRKHSNIIQQLFKNEPTGFSPVLHLTGSSLQNVIESSVNDVEYFSRKCGGNFSSLLDKSLDADKDRSKETVLAVRPKDRALVDYVICAERSSWEAALRVKKELGF